MKNLVENLNLFCWKTYPLHDYYTLLNYYKT